MNVVASPAAHSLRALRQLSTVDVWVVDLEQSPDQVARLASVLSADEQVRASRFVFDHHRRYFCVGRAALRHILAGYLDVGANDLEFQYGRRGKPALVQTASAPLEFNVSHAASVAVVAIAAGGPLGVDVESRSRSVDFVGLASRFFAPVECCELLALAPEERPDAFFRCWTRKEAYIKAIGDGLACPLDSFAVTLRAGQPPAIRWIAGDDAAAWRMAEFEPHPGAVAAVATRWCPTAIDIREWTPLDSSVRPRSSAGL